MKFKNVIKSAFEKEEQKEAAHIKSLEKQILLKIHEEDLDHEVKTYFPQRKSFWATSVPYAFATILIIVVLLGVTTNSQVHAKGSILDALVNLRNQLQQELSNLLFNDPSYRDKETQKYKQTQQEWCSVSARAPEEQEKAVTAIRDFLDRPDARVDYECVVKNPNKPNEKPVIETYTVDFDLFVIDIKTNKIIEMSPKQGTWGENKDGTRWSSPEKEYDYTPRYTQTEAEQLALDFIKNHERAIGKINLDKFELETGTKSEGENVNYTFIWKNDKQKITLTYTQGGQIVAYSNVPTE